MSVYIPGMEMPKNCHSCWVTDYCLENHFGIFANGNGKPCPLVEVKTPHGRLIDADANIYVLDKCCANTDSAYERSFYSFAVQIMRECPTIIEAEGGGEDG